MSKSKPTVLDVFLECLHIVQELPPEERERVIAALENFKTWSPNTLRCPPRDPEESP